MAFLKRNHIALAAIILFIIFVEIFALGPGSIPSGDSDGYRNPALPHDFSRLILSISGNWYRSPAIVGPYELIGNDDGIVFFQFFLSWISSLSLYWAISSFFQNLKLALVIAITSELVLLSPFVISWNWLILSESITISFVVLSLSFLLFYLKTSRKLYMLIVVFCAGYAIFIRPQLALIYIPAFAVLVLFAIKNWKLFLKNFVLLALTISITYISSLWWNSNFEFWRTQLPRSVFTAVHTMSGMSPIAEEIREAVDVELPPPSCFTIPNDEDDVNELITENSKCSPAKTWSEEYVQWLPKFLLSNPKTLLLDIAWSTPKAIASPALPAGFSPIPTPLTEIVMGNQSISWVGGNRPIGNTSEAFYSDLLLGLVPFLGLAFIYRARKNWKFTEFRKGFLLYMVAVLALITATTGAIMLPSSALEIARIGSSAAVMFRLALIVSIGTLFVKTAKSSD